MDKIERQDTITTAGHLDPHKHGTILATMAMAPTRRPQPKQPTAPDRRHNKKAKGDPKARQRQGPA